MKQPIKFLPYFKSTIWGGEKISRFKGITLNCNNIGESWELSDLPGCESIVADGDDSGMTLNDLVEKYKGRLVGESVYRRFGNRFPLLIKFIDASADLSLQVHPDDELAMKRHNSFGKTEMWYILDTEKRAKIHTGLTRTITPDEYERRVNEKTLMDVVGSYDSTVGDMYYLPAGRLHAIGAGNFLVEIQESSDVTYRVDDYDRRDANGKARELHTELAKEAIDYEYYSDCKSSTTELSLQDSTELVNCQHFNVCKEDVAGSRTICNPEDSFMGLVCIKGNGNVKVSGISTSVKQGETLLLPAHINEFDVEGVVSFLTVVVPSLQTRS